MDLSFSLDTDFRKYLRLDDVGFTTFEFFEANHATVLRRRRNVNLEDVIMYNYFSHGTNLSISNVLVSSVALIEVDNILKKIISKEEIEEVERGALYDYPGFDSQIQNLTPITNMKFIQASAFNETILQQSSAFLRNYVIVHILPFFEAITSLQAVNDLVINQVPNERLGFYIPGDFTYAKKLIIMKLCDNPGYGAHVSWVLETLEKSVAIDSARWSSKYEIHKKLIDYLK